MKTYPQAMSPPSIQNITARFLSPAQSRIGLTPSASVRMACLNDLTCDFSPFRASTTSKRTTPFSLSYFFTPSTRTCVEVLHIFCVRVEFEALGPPADEPVEWQSHGAVTIRRSGQHRGARAGGPDFGAPKQLREAGSEQGT